MMVKYKVSDLAKDFNMKTKDVIDVLSNAGMDKKTSGTIDSEEFAVFLDQVTASNQTTNMSDYLSGKADIPKASEKKAETIKPETASKASKQKTTVDAPKEIVKAEAMDVLVVLGAGDVEDYMEEFRNILESK